MVLLSEFSFKVSKLLQPGLECARKAEQCNLICVSLFEPMKGSIIIRNPLEKDSYTKPEIPNSCFTSLNSPNFCVITNLKQPCGIPNLGVHYLIASLNTKS